MGKGRMGYGVTYVMSSLFLWLSPSHLHWRDHALGPATPVQPLQVERLHKYGENILNQDPMQIALHVSWHVSIYWAHAVNEHERSHHLQRWIGLESFVKTTSRSLASWSVAVNSRQAVLSLRPGLGLSLLPPSLTFLDLVSRRILRSSNLYIV